MRILTGKGMLQEYGPEKKCMHLVDEIFDEYTDRQKEQTGMDLYRGRQRRRLQPVQDKVRRSWHHPYVGTEHLLLALQKGVYRRSRRRCWQ